MTGVDSSITKEIKKGVSVESMHEASATRLDDEKDSTDAEKVLTKGGEEAKQAESFDHGPNDAGRQVMERVPRMIETEKNMNNNQSPKALCEPRFDIKQIRERARQNVESGAVTADYECDPEEVVKMLNEALATEIVCVLRYRRHFYMARGVNSESVAAEFLQHSNEELGHADKLALRIAQLGGEPDLNPDTLTTRSHAEYVAGKDLKDMIKEDLVAERIAIESYRSMIERIGTKDPTTRRLLEEILGVEEEHADELSNLLQ